MENPPCNGDLLGSVLAVPDHADVEKRFLPGLRNPSGGPSSALYGIACVSLQRGDSRPRGDTHVVAMDFQAAS